MPGNTPKQSYPSAFVPQGQFSAPQSGPYGDVYGAMANSPGPGYGYPVGQQGLTPMANPAAVRAYTRNAPYMEKYMSAPQDILLELYTLQQAIKEDPNDVVSEYRARVLRGALRDVFGLQAPDELYGFDLDRAQAPATPQGYTPLTPKGYRY